MDPSRNRADAFLPVCFPVDSAKHRLFMFRLLAIFLALAPALFARDFDPRRDAFSFANETVFAYDVDKAGQMHVKAKAAPEHLTHRCFCFTRAVMQFWNFARFEPGQRRLSPEEYRTRLRALFRIPVWSRRTDRIGFPGFRNLWDFSKAHELLVQEEFGSWVLTYLRVGNWRMACPLVRFLQRETAEHLLADVTGGKLRAVYLAKFPSMNHAVIVFAGKRLPGGGIRFQVYDSNYAGASARLDYVPARNLFDFERRFYWPGGALRAFPVYTSPFE